METPIIYEFIIVQCSSMFLTSAFNKVNKLIHDLTFLVLQSYVYFQRPTSVRNLVSDCTVCRGFESIHHLQQSSYHFWRNIPRLLCL